MASVSVAVVVEEDFSVVGSVKWSVSVVIVEVLLAKAKLHCNRSNVWSLCKGRDKKRKICCFLMYFHCSKQEFTAVEGMCGVFVKEEIKKDWICCFFYIYIFTTV